VEAMWATWYAGGIAVPLAESYPTEEVKYVLQDAGEWGVARRRARPRRERVRGGEGATVAVLQAPGGMWAGAPAHPGCLLGVGRGRGSRGTLALPPHGATHHLTS
jgi:hypothetical protein